MWGELGITVADVVAGSMGGWIAMNHAIYAPHRVRRLVLLGPLGLPSWRATLRILGPMMSMVLRPTDEKAERLIKRGTGEGERVNRELGAWMHASVACKPRTAQPLPLSASKLRSIKMPTLVILGGKDPSVLGLVGYGAASDALEFASTIGGVLVVPLAVLALVAARAPRSHPRPPAVKEGELTGERTTWPELLGGRRLYS